MYDGAECDLAFSSKQQYAFYLPGLAKHCRRFSEWFWSTLYIIALSEWFGKFIWVETYIIKFWYFRASISTWYSSVVELSKHITVGIILRTDCFFENGPVVSCHLLETSWWFYWSQYICSKSVPNSSFRAAVNLCFKILIKMSLCDAPSSPPGVSHVMIFHRP